MSVFRVLVCICCYDCSDGWKLCVMSRETQGTYGWGYIWWHISDVADENGILAEVFSEQSQFLSEKKSGTENF